MKYIAFIISIYFLTLNFLPCEDASEQSDDSQTEIVQNMDIDHDHNDADLCSPFCQCHCCHIHVLNFDLDAYSIHTPLISTRIFIHPDAIAKDIMQSILQPPQLLS